MRGLRVVVCLAGVAALVVIVPIVHRSPEATYGGADTRLLVLEAGAALALLVIAGVGPPRVAAVLVAAVGAVWLVPEIAGAASVSPLARTVADAVGPVIVAVMLVCLVLRTGHVDPLVRRPMLAAVVGAAVGAAVASFARLLLVDPFDQVDCWRTCEHNPLRDGAGGAGAAVEPIALAGVAVGVLCSAVLLLGGRRQGRAATTETTADLAGWFLLLGLVVSLFVQPAGVTSATEDRLAVAVFVLVQAAAVAWLAALGWEAWLRWRLAARLTRLVHLLRSRPGSEALAGSLRTAVRDPGLRLAYWAPARQMYVDGQGRATSGATPGPDERSTTIKRRGETIAAIIHSRRVDGRRLERALGPALRVALENEQLRAAALAELEELERSRTRVVERAALERRRLERNLHDGAQQRVVSLALLVRMLAGRSAAVDRQAGRRAEVLTRTLTEELRRVARGIYPAVLADAGLAGAVVDLAEQSEDLPVVVGEFPEERYPGTLESTAYLVVRAGIADARARSATGATVWGTQVDGVLRISVEDDAASAPEQVATELADQVDAVGGSLVVDGAPGRRRVEVVLPCVS